MVNEERERKNYYSITLIAVRFGWRRNGAIKCLNLSKQAINSVKVDRRRKVDLLVYDIKSSASVITVARNVI